MNCRKRKLWPTSGTFQFCEPLCTWPGSAWFCVNTVLAYSSTPLRAPWWSMGISYLDIHCSRRIREYHELHEIILSQISRREVESFAVVFSTPKLSFFHNFITKWTFPYSFLLKCIWWLWKTIELVLICVMLWLSLRTDIIIILSLLFIMSKANFTISRAFFVLLQIFYSGFQHTTGLPTRSCRWVRCVQPTGPSLLTRLSSSQSSN